MASTKSFTTFVLLSCTFLVDSQQWRASPIVKPQDQKIYFQNNDASISSVQPLDYVDKQIANGILQMTLQLNNALAVDASNENVLFSPTSIAMTLAMVLLGAGGQTSAEITRVLGLSRGGQLIERREVLHEKYGSLLWMLGQSSSRSTLTKLATAVFVQNGYRISESFQRKTQEIYRSDVIPLNFNDGGENAKDSINRWVSARTAGRIKELLQSPPPSNTKLLLASTLYFNGEWEHPFPDIHTRSRPFYVSGLRGEEVINIPLMVNAAEIPYYHDRVLGCQIASLPYKGKEIFMHIILPSITGYAALQALSENIKGTKLDEMIENTVEQTVIFTLPRMKLESTISLKSSLKSLGLKSLFDWTTSDLSQITNGIDWMTAFNNSSNNFVKGRNVGNPGLFADDVVHKVEVEVTETGTVASAATALSISRTGNTPSLRADRPFIFFIRHEKTKLVLFWGTVIKPTLQ